MIFAGSVKIDDFDCWEMKKRLVCFEDKGQTPVHLDHYKDRKMFVILDSGAFSAWTKGKSIDIDEYVELIIKNDSSICMAANLDIIPGKKGDRQITEETNIRAASDGWKNYLRILETLKWNGREDLCSRIMPIHHQGESIDFLKRMVDFGCEYIGISPSNDATTNQRKKYLDLAFGYLENCGTRIFTHGYAVTSEELMALYPWLTVDSISWIFTAGLGFVKTPYGNMCFSEDPRSLKLKENMRITVNEDGDFGIDNAEFVHLKKEVEDYFLSLNISIFDLSRHYTYRAIANMFYFQIWEKSNVRRGFFQRETQIAF